MIDHISKYYCVFHNCAIADYHPKDELHKRVAWRGWIEKVGNMELCISSTNAETIITDTMIHKYVWCVDSMSFEHWKENVKKEND